MGTDTLDKVARVTMHKQKVFLKQEWNLCFLENKQNLS